MHKVSHIQFASPVRVGNTTNNNHFTSKHNKDMLVEWDGEFKFYITHIPSGKKIVVFSTNVAFAEMADESSEVTGDGLRANDSSGVIEATAAKRSRRKKSVI